MRPDFDMQALLLISSKMHNMPIQDEWQSQAQSSQSIESAEAAVVGL